MSEAEQPIPASDLPTRFVMGVVMVAVAVLAIYLGGWVFRLLVLAAAAVMLLEWADMHRVDRRWGYGGIALLAGNLLAVPEILFPAGQIDAIIAPATFEPAWGGFAAVLASGAFLGLLSQRLTMFGGFAYIAIPAFALLVLNWVWFAIVFWVMLVVWATDIFAYFAGRSIGGAKLAPRISPNKTWAGLIGGMAEAGVIGALTASWFGLGAPFLYIGAPMGAVAQGGDLYESWLKRRAGVKDSGTILPGHGGALDRLDGLLPVIVATLALLMAGYWTA
jgi:phosphatidate cytidylyltransferase